MNRPLIIAILALSASTLTVTGYAQAYQNAPVSISQEKETIDGQVFFRHTVSAHQTLFSIAKTYGVNYQEIIDANKSIDLKNGGLKVGQVLLIPDKTTAKPEASTAVDVIKVIPQENQQLSQAEDEYTIYVAKWYDDLDGLASKFNISKDILMAFNGMTDETISRRQKIKIPSHPERIKIHQETKTVAENAIIEKEQRDNVEMKNDIIPQETERNVTAEESVAESEKGSFSRFFKKDNGNETISVGVVLPFNAKGELNSSAYDLYSGILLAVRDLSYMGIKTELTVRDCRPSLSQTICDAMKESDIILGPISPDDISSILSNVSPDIPVISPLDPKAAVLAVDYPNFIQAPSSSETQYQDMIRWIKEDYSEEDKVFLISEKGKPASAVAAILQDSGIPFITVNYGILEAEQAINKLESQMTAQGVNHAVIASDSEAFVNDAVRNLNLMTYKDFDVVFYGPSKIRNFETVEVESLHNINSHICCSYYVDYESTRIKNFLLSYRALFGTEPTPFSYQGYDAAYYFIRNFAMDEMKGKAFDKGAEHKFRGLQSDFMIQEEDSRKGLVNQGIRRIIYGDDFSVRLLNL